MEFTTVWFILIAVLWTGYFVREGFDFGVGMLMPVHRTAIRMNQTVVSSMMSLSVSVSLSLGQGLSVGEDEGGVVVPIGRVNGLFELRGAGRDEPQQQLRLDDGQNGIQQGEGDQRGPDLTG